MSDLTIPVIISVNGSAPQYAHPTDAGADITASENVTIEPGDRAIVATGIRAAILPGYVGLVHPRSGLAAKHGVTVLNAPGTIDADYRGEIKVILLNTDRNIPFIIRVGDRIAQLVIQKVEHANFVIVDDLDQTVRGTGGFGSTGVQGPL